MQSCTPKRPSQQINNRAWLWLAALMVLGIVGCTPSKGSFYWAVNDLKKMGQLDRTRITPSTYHKGRSKLRFEKHEQIWWLYKFPHSPWNPEFYYTVSKRTFGWVEKFRRRIMYSEALAGFNDNFLLEDDGCFQIKLFQDSEQFDAVTFRIIPDTNSIFDETLDEKEQNQDDIRKYSASVNTADYCPP